MREGPGLRERHRESSHPAEATGGNASQDGGLREVFVEKLA